MHESTSLDVVLECLERSGYLLESTLVRALADHGYFVEPNQVIRDVRTGKSREIDIVAEYFDHVPEHNGVCVKTYFVAEVINNKFPIVLMTERPSSPNEKFEEHVKFACTPEPNPFNSAFDVYGERGPDRHDLFSQYCALTPKKADKQELMAFHPDDMYGSLQKLAEYTEEQLNEFRNWEEDDSKFWRMFFWHPMLVLGGQLVVVGTGEDGSPKLREVSSSYLEFNWHEGEEQRTTIIEFVTKAEFLNRLAKRVEEDAIWQVKLNELRRAHYAASPFIEDR